MRKAFPSDISVENSTRRYPHKFTIVELGIPVSSPSDTRKSNHILHRDGLSDFWDVKVVVLSRSMIHQAEFLRKLSKRPILFDHESGQLENILAIKLIFESLAKIVSVIDSYQLNRDRLLCPRPTNT